MGPDLAGNLQDLFFQLTPDFVLDAIEACGWRTTGEYLQLNSYENRVYSVRVEEPAGAQVIAKFYRPGRWNEAAILEEHEFLSELGTQGVPVVAPYLQKNGRSLSVHGGLFCAIFPKAKGRMPQEFSKDGLERLGRLVARLHNIGGLQPSRSRPVLDAEHMGRPALDTVSRLVPGEWRPRYVAAAEEILGYLSEASQSVTMLRIHGDCHRGNVLETDEPGRPKEYFLIDFDDFGTGPAAQDMWMLFRNDEDDVDEEIDAFLAGYTDLREFDERELDLLEPLRGLRILHYASWIARRWSDPSFPRLFPNFGSDAYWFEELQALEKIAAKIG